MDARPQRTFRPFTGAGNENLLPTQFAHQTKSIGNQNLTQVAKHAINLSHATGPSHATRETFEVKRTAFGDMSNMVQPTKTGEGHIRSNEKTLRGASGQENNASTWAVKGDKKQSGAQQQAVSHPRPVQQLETSGLGRLATGEQKIIGALQLPATHGNKKVTANLPWKISDKTNGTRRTAVYHDGQHHDDLTSAPPKAVKDPRRIQSHLTLTSTSSLAQPTTTYAVLEDLPRRRGPMDDITGRHYVDALEHQHPKTRKEYSDMLAQLDGDFSHASGGFVEQADDDDGSEPGTDQDYITFHSGADLTIGGITTLLAPKVTSSDRKEMSVARRVIHSTTYVEEYEEEEWDVTMVAEYSEEIFEYLKTLEIRLLPSPYYMDIQTEIQWSMRSILMDWIVQVHIRFQLLPETLFLCVNYIDRFLSVKVVSLGKLQLVGITALFLAAKYEEINCPSLKEVVQMVDKGYSSEEIMKAERFMLTMLNFDLGWPGPLSFLRRISKADEYDVETRTMSKYLLDVSIMDERFVATPPSYLAAGAQCLSRIILDKGPWDHAHVFWSGYTFEQLRPVVNLLLECCQDPERHHIAVFNKFKGQKYHRTALVVQDAIQAGLKVTNFIASSSLASMPLPSPPQTAKHGAYDRAGHMGSLHS